MANRRISGIKRSDDLNFAISFMNLLFKFKSYFSVLERLQLLIKSVFANKETKFRIYIRRSVNQDGLENFFGCLRAYQNSSSLIAMHFRSSYATAFVSNFASAHSIHSNCEADLSKPLLSDMHEFFLNDDRNELNDCGAGPSTDLTSYKNDGFEYDFNPVSIKVQFSEEVLSSKNNYVDAACDVCDKLMKVTKCIACRGTFETIDKNDRCTKPSDLLIENFTRIASACDKILPEICEEQFLKKTLLKYISSEVTFQSIGCSEHFEEVELKFKGYSAIWGLQHFCKNVNDLLSGKNTHFSNKFNKIEENAFNFYQKRKRVGKYSDILKI